MKSVITGVNGFVGSWLAEYLLELGEDVIGFKRWRSSVANIHKISGHKHFKLYDVDLLEPVRMLEIFNKEDPNYVYHLAAQSFPPYSVDNPIQTVNVNVIGTMNLLDAIRNSDAGSKVHICSSSEVYGTVEKEDIPIKETQSLHPASPYGASKAAMDLMAQVYAKTYDMKLFITRAFTHTGPRRNKMFVVSAFAKQIAEIERYPERGNKLKVGNLRSTRTFLDVRDIVKAYKALMIYGKAGEIYNIGGDHVAEIGAMLIDLISMSKAKIEVVEDPSLLRKCDVTLQVPDTTKMQELTKWKPTILFTQTLQDTLNYWRKRV